MRVSKSRTATKTWDKVWFVVFLTNVFALWFVAVRDFDTRIVDLGWPENMWFTGLAILVSGWTLFTWSSVANPFFEATVRIQMDHRHQVIDGGPYAFVRHPGYVGLIAACGLSTPLLLPSFWICVLSFIAAVVVVIRTALEDRTLQEELPGYAEYATKVRFRLIPGVW